MENRIDFACWRMPIDVSKLAATYTPLRGMEAYVDAANFAVATFVKYGMSASSGRMVLLAAPGARLEALVPYARSLAGNSVANWIESPDRTGGAAAGPLDPFEVEEFEDYLADVVGLVEAGKYAKADAAMTERLRAAGRPPVWWYSERSRKLVFA